jgi:hypothetical protein
MSNRDLQTAIEDDPDGKLTVDSAVKASWTNVDKNDTTLLYFNDGDIYNQDVDIDADVNSTLLQDNGEVAHFHLSDETGSLAVLRQVGQTANCISITAQRTAGGTARFLLREYVDGVLQAATAVQNYNLVQQLYYQYEIDWSGAVLTFTVYTDEARTTTAFTPKTYTISKDRTLSINNVFGSMDTGGGASAASGVTENFVQRLPALEEPVDGTLTTAVLGDREQDSSAVYSGEVGSTKTSVTTDTHILVYSINAYNAGETDAYLQFIDNLEDNVVIGSSTPDYVVGIPAGEASDVWFDKPLRMRYGCTIASTSTRDGSSGVTTDVTITYRSRA